MSTTKLYLETTTVPAMKSIGEITAELVKAGALEISTTYGPNASPVGVRWAMKIHGYIAYFALPVKTDAVERVLSAGKRLTFDQRRAMADRAQRVAWRQLLVWVRVQMAMIQLQQVEFAQVFLPYMQESAQNPVTVWDHIREQRFKQLEATKPQ
jgi:hypothetical protein